MFVSLIDNVAAYGDAEDDTLFNIENLTGSAQNDTLWGNNGVNVLRGMAGNDTLKGFGGADSLTGDAGADLFVWGSASHTGVTAATADVITDFNRGQGDHIDLSGIDANLVASGNQAFTFIGTAAFSGAPGQLRYFQSGSNTFIEMQTGTWADSEGMIRLNGLDTPDASWFVL